MNRGCVQRADILPPHADCTYGVTVIRRVASLGLPNLTFSGEPADTHNTIDVIRRLMTDSRRSVEETNKVTTALPARRAWDGCSLVRR